MGKLWDKGIETNKLVEQFTVGLDREMDLYLAPFDVLGTMAHITMLESIGLLGSDELPVLLAELKKIYATTQSGNFVIEDDVEDVHSQVEFLLTKALGDMGKKVHSGRSRNDQVLVDMKLYLRHEVEEIVGLVKSLFDTLIQLSNKYKDYLMPGYTHLQVAMPSSFGVWFGAYAESLSDDLTMLRAAYKIINQNPLGSAAGYGSSFPLNRTMTTRLLGFNDLNYNVVYSQMGRGKTEQNLSFAMAALAQTLSRMAMDMCMYNSQDLGFVKLPDEFTTGSSIMPHKKNPDVWELVRGKCNRIKALPTDITLTISNLPSGYHRDLQLLKEQIIPAINDIKQCLTLAELMLKNVKIKENILAEPKYALAFSVEVVNKLVLEGMPFRDAYKKVALDIQAGKFVPETHVNHTHEGSIGNLCNEQISNKFNATLNEFEFNSVANAISNLLK
ncbi:MAG: argininosuccinate lyase [Salinivirgaceae bacterium]|nr:argininosuccinate lyase [Salinivirgaceae bacterium]